MISFRDEMLGQCTVSSLGLTSRNDSGLLATQKDSCLGTFGKWLLARGLLFSGSFIISGARGLRAGGLGKKGGEMKKILLALGMALVGSGCSGQFEALTSPEEKTTSYGQLALFGDGEFFVAPDAVGDGSGISLDNAAAADSSAFWNDIARKLADGKRIAVWFTVQFGNIYDKPIVLKGLGVPGGPGLLRIRGHIWPKPATIQSVLHIAYSHNIEVMNLRFTGGDSPMGSGYTSPFKLEITSDPSGQRPSSQISVSECVFEKVTTSRGGMLVYKGSHRIHVFKNRFVDLTYSGGLNHAIYAIDGVHSIKIYQNEFRDITGTYVNLRNGVMRDVWIYENSFRSTQSMFNYPFVFFGNYNDAPSDTDTFAESKDGVYVTINSNSFEYTATGDNRHAIALLHWGYEANGGTSHCLYNKSEGSQLISGSLATRKMILEACRIFPDKIWVWGNNYTHSQKRVVMESRPKWFTGPDYWNTFAEIDEILQNK